MNKKIQNYKGIKPANIITILEGNGTPEFPHQNVMYVVAYEMVGGIECLVTIGKIVDLNDEEKNNFF